MNWEAWRLTICAICLMIVMGGALYNFGFLLLQKLHSMIIKFKTSSEFVAVGRNYCKHVISRPLTYQSSDPREDVPLTPNHFLQGQMGGQFVPDSVETTPLPPRQRWRKVQGIISQVWRRWLKECIPALNSRPKWTSEFRDLKVGDVVLVIQPDTPRGRWPLGRIAEVYPGRDGHTRVAKVACGVKTVVRRINKLIPLGINF